MRMQEVQIKARGMGIKLGKMKKVDLVRAIQLQEGNYPCFMTADDYCDQAGCCWRDDCLSNGGGVKAIKKRMTRPKRRMAG